MFTDSRAPDAVAVVLGAIAALSPIWVDTSNRAMWTLIVLGVLIAATGLAQLAKVAGATADYAMAVLGALLFLSPWVMNFSSYTNASWTAWIVGVLTVVVALAALPQVAGRMHTAH
ncbi:SPW repeat protein [Nocardia otitidiscaviarum]|uniref:SPW repeat protein n=1 Tax=Nocardia otitidiscaviarum TaxID=1823 RepID=UPI0018958112|nr:SPW repeat protein [Nocardia otitidiscaviarum]MBF6240066.1 SPW repeat protein [Nocardia otitidiscaviarum]